MENIMKRENGRKRKGFMLMELIIVVAIIGVLAAVAVPNLVGFTDDAKVARIQSDLSAISTAAEVYYTKNGAYPKSAKVLVDAGLLKSEPKPPAGKDGSETIYSVGDKGEVTVVFNGKKYSSFGTTTEQGTTTNSSG